MAFLKYLSVNPNFDWTFFFSMVLRKFYVDAYISLMLVQQSFRKEYLRSPTTFSIKLNYGVNGALKCMWIFSSFNFALQ